MGMHMGDLVMNWRQRRYRRPTLLLLLALATFDLLNASSMTGSLSTGETVSHAAHFGGYVAGLLACIWLGRVLVVYRRGRVLQVLTVVLGICLITFCLWWGQQWPPRDIWDEVEWCWSRQVYNPSDFSDFNWHCVRCFSEACIKRWSAFEHHHVSQWECGKIGWTYTEPSS